MFAELLLGAVTAVTSVSDVQACLPLPGGTTLAATAGGLVMIDGAGRTVRVLTALDGLGGTAAYALAQGADGHVWVGTEGGLAELDAGGTRVLRTFAARPVRAILGHGGTLFAASWGGGLLSLRGDSLVRVGDAAQATSLAAQNGRLFVGTAGDGVYVLDGDSLRPLPASTALPSRIVWSLAARGDTLLVGTVAGLAQLDGEHARTRDAHDVRALLVDGDITLEGTYGEGVIGRTGPAFVNGITRAHGHTCIAARDGLTLDGKAVALAGPPSNDVSALLVRGDGVWIGTFDRGLVRLGDDGRIAAVSGIDARVDALLSDADGKTLWVGTARGLSRVDPRGLRELRRFTTADGLPGDEVHSLARLPGGAIVAGTTRGAAILRGDRIEVIDRKRGLEGDAVWALAADGDALWLGTSRGLWRWEPSRRRVRRFATATGHLDEDWVTALLVDGETLWVGTYSKGVTRLTRDGKTRWIGTPLGGGAINVGGLSLVAGKLHAATMDGLLAREEDSWVARPGAAPGKDVTAVALRNDTLWVASRRGLGRISCSLSDGCSLQ